MKWLVGQGAQVARRLATAPTILLVFLLCRSSWAATYYLDGSVGASGNGTSWASAWKNFSNITGLQPGDKVYVSGGSTTQAYALSNWTPTGGTSGNPITYAVGQDAGHNGVVTITSANFLNGTLHDVIIDGNVGGAQHWSVTTSGYLWEGGSGTNQRVTLRYIAVVNMRGGFHWANVSNTALEIDHCHIVKDNDYLNINDFIFFGGPGTGVGQVNVHDNYIQFPLLSSDHSYGDDMWIWPGNVNFYNNTVRGVRRSTYGSGSVQHADLFQTNQSSNIRVYNNTFIDPGESAFYEDSQGGGTSTGIYIYNNLYVRTFPCNGGAQRIFDMIPENGGAGTAKYVDMVIANNTIVDDSDGACIFGIRVAGAGSYTRVFVVNNLGYPSGGTDVTADAGVTVSNNYDGNAAKVVSYVQYGGTNNDLHLTSADAVARDKGRDMSTYFSTDKDGVTRPQGSAWDIGAYEFNSGAPPPPPPSGSACDVNSDGTTNVVDVQQEVNQALGIATCKADINKDGQCTVVDVQRVVNAALGGQCVTQ
jgi:hypothetical protein